MAVKLSIVIPTYNRLEILRRVLRALEVQTLPLDDFDVYVVCDGSTDGTIEYLKRLETPLQLHFLMQENQGPAAARNYGVSQASGELICFLDDDVVPVSTWLEEHLRIHTADQAQQVVLGPMLSPPDYQLSPWGSWEQSMLDKQYADMQAGKYAPTARQFYTGNTSLPRQCLLDAGGFDVHFRRAEDVELAYRLAERGLRFSINPKAIGHHYIQRSFQSWVAVPYAYGVNDVIFATQKGQSWLLPVLWREYASRNVMTRGLVYCCLDRPGISALVSKALSILALQTGRLGFKRLGRFALSAIFNLRYYQGVADQMGGRKVFTSNVSHAPHTVQM